MQQIVNDMEELWTLPEAIKYLRISRPTAMRWLKEGKLPSRKVGGTYRFYPSELKQVIKPIEVSAKTAEQGEA